MLVEFADSDMDAADSEPTTLPSLLRICPSKLACDENSLSSLVEPNELRRGRETRGEEAALIARSSSDRQTGEFDAWRSNRRWKKKNCKMLLPSIHLLLLFYYVFKKKLKEKRNKQTEKWVCT